MTRIIGGEAGGRRLRTPTGESTRPTSDRVREALFSALEALLGSVQGLRFLDLYAGSGAVGLEARSRGAGVVTCVEQDRRTAALVRDNTTLDRDQVSHLNRLMSEWGMLADFCFADLLLFAPTIDAVDGQIVPALRRLREGFSGPIDGALDLLADPAHAKGLEIGTLVYAVARNMLASKELAEEATQQTFVKAWQAAGWLLHHRTSFAKSMVILKECRNVRYGQFVAPGNVLTVDIDEAQIDEIEFRGGTEGR